MIHTYGGGVLCVSLCVGLFVCTGTGAAQRENVTGLGRRVSLGSTGATLREGWPQ